jgi:tryptophan-rich sensory protein
MASTSQRSPLVGLALWLGVTLVAAALGRLASVDAAAFYAALDKPTWAPPASAFGPVWAVLYVTMAVAAWLVWKARGFGGAARALRLYLVQLAANALWSFLFFAWHRGALAFADIVVLCVLVAATAVAFWRVRAAAGLLIVPYLAWIGFAACLNYSVWQRNPSLLG